MNKNTNIVNVAGAPGAGIFVAYRYMIHRSLNLSLKYPRRLLSLERPKLGHAVPPLARHWPASFI